MPIPEYVVRLRDSYLGRDLDRSLVQQLLFCDLLELEVPELRDCYWQNDWFQERKLPTKPVQQTEVEDGEESRPIKHEPIVSENTLHFVQQLVDEALGV